MRSGRSGKARVLWPLPGGAGRYLKSLRAFTRMAKDAPSTDEFLIRVLKQFPHVTSAKAAHSYLRVAVILGMLEVEGGRVVLTPSGESYRKAASSDLVTRALLDRVAGTEELLAELESRPGRLGDLQERMRAHGFDWQTPSQVRYRLHWLEQVGLVRRVGKKYPEYGCSRPLASLS